MNAKARPDKHLHRSLSLLAGAALALLSAAGDCRAQAPRLDAPRVAALPNVTARSFEFTGAGLDRVTAAEFGSLKLGLGGPADWDTGYVERVNAYQIRVYPPQGLPPGKFALRVLAGSYASNAQVVELLHPKERYTRSNAAISAGSVQTIRGCKSSLPDSTLGLLTASDSKLPSKIDGVISLGIGDAFRKLLLLVPARLFDLRSGIVSWQIQTPQLLRGKEMHFQVVLIDAKDPHARPFLTTDVHTTRYF